jgi:hypothetical protein
MFSQSWKLDLGPHQIRAEDILDNMCAKGGLSVREDTPFNLFELGKRLRQRAFCDSKTLAWKCS